MSVVVTPSAVLTAVIPTIVGVALGNHLTIAAGAGVVIAIPAIGLVSWQRQTSDRERSAAQHAPGCFTACSPGWDSRSCSSR